MEIFLNGLWKGWSSGAVGAAGCVEQTYGSSQEGAALVIYKEVLHDGQQKFVQAQGSGLTSLFHRLSKHHKEIANAHSLRSRFAEKYTAFKRHMEIVSFRVPIPSRSYLCTNEYIRPVFHACLPGPQCSVYLFCGKLRVVCGDRGAMMTRRELITR